MWSIAKRKLSQSQGLNTRGFGDCDDGKGHLIDYQATPHGSPRAIYGGMKFFSDRGYAVENPEDYVQFFLVKHNQLLYLDMEHINLSTLLIRVIFVD
ncbi:hypothetical protein V6N13_144013 [Hibiscus sabdariffa]